MRIVFIIGSLTDSHIIKRVDAFINAGYEVEVYGYKRGVNFTNKFERVQPTIIGVLENSKYLKRVIKGYKEISSIIKSYPKNTLFYVWGFDIALVHFICRSRYIYEISDIRWAEFSPILRWVFKLTDRMMIRRSKLSLFTSEGFIGYIGIPKDLNDRVVLMPNKLAPTMLSLNRPILDECVNKIRLGYIGLYRYPNTVVKMARIVGEKFKDRYEFHFSGISNDVGIKTLIADLCDKYPNIYEHGPFRNPDDLERVYSTIDVVAANYDTAGNNERIAEPNKLYESIFFNKPIIVSEGTFLSEKVNKIGCGFVINNSEESIISFLNELTISRVNSIISQTKEIPSEELIEDYNELWTKVNEL